MGEENHGDPHRKIKVPVFTNQFTVPEDMPDTELTESERLEDRIAPSLIMPGTGGMEGMEEPPPEDPMAGDPTPGDDITAPPDPNEPPPPDPDEPPPPEDPNEPPP